MSTSGVVRARVVTGTLVALLATAVLALVVAGRAGARPVWANAVTVLEDDIFRRAGFYHGPRGLDIDAAPALVQRHSHFWRAVGLFAGAFMREKTLDGSGVVALVRVAQE